MSEPVPPAPSPSAPGGAAPDAKPEGGLPLHARMVIGLVLGALLGVIVHAAAGEVHAAAVKSFVDNVAAPIGQLFLRMIFMVVVPLVVASLMLAVIELGDVKALGRVGLKTLIYTVFASGISVVIGVGLVNVVRPGDRVDEPTRKRLLEDHGKDGTKHVENAKKARSWKESLVGLSELIPKNPLQSAVEALSGEMLALMVFALLFGAAIARVRDPTTEAMVGVLHALQKASLQVIAWAMQLAPFAVFALLFALTARTGLTIFVSLGAYVLCVIFGLALQLVVVYGLVLALVARVPVVEWFRRCREVVITAFSTASSNATLPLSLRTSEQRLGIEPKVGTFVLTVGATGNQNGTALFEGVTVLFLAQAFGVQLTVAQQVTVVLMSILAGVGTAGVPGGSLPLICVVLQSVGVPPEGIALILGVDRLLDMCRTVLNVVGDLVCATVVARLEGALRFDSVS